MIPHIDATLARSPGRPAYATGFWRAQVACVGEKLPPPVTRTFPVRRTDAEYPFRASGIEPVGEKRPVEGSKRAAVASR